MTATGLHVRELFASAAPERIIKLPGSGLQHGRNNITVRGPLQQTISRWFRVRCVRDVTKLACRSMVEVNLLL